MSTYKDIALEILTLTDKADFAAREQLMTEDVEWLVPGYATTGRAGTTAFSVPMVAAFPDGHHECPVVVEEGDTVVVEGVWTATHTAPLVTPHGELPATGNAVELPFSMLVRFEGDLAASVRVYFDQMGFMAQLTG